LKNALFQGFLFLKAQHKVSSRWQRTVERGAEPAHHPHRPPREPSPQRGWRVITTRHLHGGAGTKKEKALQFREGRVKGGQDLYFFAAFLYLTRGQTSEDVYLPAAFLGDAFSIFLDLILWDFLTGRLPSDSKVGDRLKPPHQALPDLWSPKEWFTFVRFHHLDF